MDKLEQYYDSICSDLKVYDKEKVIKTCEALIDDLKKTAEPIDQQLIAKIMQQLRNKRMFRLMTGIAEAITQTELTFPVKRQYIQALIDLDNFEQAIDQLTKLEKKTAAAAAYDKVAAAENKEALGLLGRVNKQMYINALNTERTAAANQLKTAISYYLKAYNQDPKKCSWHGINVVALLRRGSTDQIKLPGFPDADQLALSILENIQEKQEQTLADAWDFATAAEACIALNKPIEALIWLSGYARMPYCDAFELNSTLRQFREVWQLKSEKGHGKILLPLLEAELLKREGGAIEFKTDELINQTKSEPTVTKIYEVHKRPQKKAGIHPEKVFGEDSFQTYKWYMTGAERCLLVARIGRDATKGEGTGFLVKGGSLHESLGEELVLMTNAHVISLDPDEDALHPDESIVTFEALDRDQEFHISEIIWSSPSTELDTSIVRFRVEDQEKLKTLTQKTRIYPISKTLPVPKSDSSQKIYVIGHPAGGTLQISLRDNILLDHQNPKIHYRTPTEGGSSGSPIFNQLWDLVGIHHAGDKEVPRLNGKPGFYEANEGIWIEAIRKDLKEVLDKQDAPKI